MNVAYCMDCMEYMKTLPDNAFDLAVVDPPYGIGENPRKALSRARSTNKWKNAKPVHYAGGDWDNERPGAEYFNELFRVSRNQVIWGANYFTRFLSPSMGWIAWYKKGQSPNSDFSDCEFAYTSFNKASKYFDFPWVGFGAVNAKEKRIHNTQKPVALYRWIYKNYAKQGDKILDFVGTEIDKTYFNLQEERFKKHIAQGTIFDTEMEAQAEQISLLQCGIESQKPVL